MVRPWQILPLEHAWLSSDVVVCTTWLGGNEVGDPFVFTERLLIEDGACTYHSKALNQRTRRPYVRGLCAANRPTVTRVDRVRAWIARAQCHLRLDFVAVEVVSSGGWMSQVPSCVRCSQGQKLGNASQSALEPSGRRKCVYVLSHLHSASLTWRLRSCLGETVPHNMK